MTTRPFDQDGNALVGLFWAVLATLFFGAAGYLLWAVLA